MDLTLRAAPQPGAGRVKISGKGSDYSGSDSTPRAIFQLNRAADHCTLEGFELCEVRSSLTGHNVESRAHHARVQYCDIHHSPNREFDLLDAAETTRPESHAVLLGNVIVKDPKCPGNRTVIHFGQDGGKEQGS